MTVNYDRKIRILTIRIQFALADFGLFSTISIESTSKNILHSP